MYDKSIIEVRDFKLIKKLETEMVPFRNKERLIKPNFSIININSLNSQRFAFGLIKNKNAEKKFAQFATYKVSLNLKKENEN